MEESNRYQPHPRNIGRRTACLRMLKVSNGLFAGQRWGPYPFLLAYDHTPVVDILDDLSGLRLIEGVRTACMPACTQQLN